MVRLGAMGDILHALPAVTALRLAHPDWTIDWVVEPRWRELLAAGEIETPESAASPNTTPARPLVNRIHFAPAKDWGRRPLSPQTLRQIVQLRSALRVCPYNAVLDLQGAVRSAAIGRLAGSLRLIGEADPRERAARWLFSQRVATQGAHVIEQDIELASAVAGDSLQAERPLLPVDSAAERWCDELLASAPSRPAVLINPGAGWGAKRWPVERYALVAHAFVERGLHVFVNTGPGEEPLAEVIVNATAGAATLLTPSLGRLIALTRRIALCVAGDTGPLHLACALQRPVVGIYGPTDPSRNGPFGTRSKVLRSPLSHRDHTRNHATEAGLFTIHPEDVLAAADALLAQETVV